MRVARILVQGVDVWLNTPRRPLEASGTSGQKAAINGALNCSVLDGWWPEAYDGTNGWAIGREEVLADVGAAGPRGRRRALRAARGGDRARSSTSGTSAASRWRWVERMKRSIATVASAFSSDRMVRDYVTKAYLGAAATAPRD